MSVPGDQPSTGSVATSSSSPPDNGPVAEVVVAKATPAQRAQEFGIRYVMVWVLAGLAIGSDIAYPGFFQWGNIKDILSQNAPVGLVAVGMTYVIICGGFDLSVASIFAGGGVFFASFDNHVPLVLAFVATMVAGGLAGAINGLIITKMRVNTFIATLATSSLFGGGALLFSNNGPVEALKPDFMDFGTNNIATIPIVVWVLAFGVIAGGFLLARTVYGRSLYAVGGNRDAARLAGIRVEWIRASTFCITGVCAAVAGMMTASQTGVGEATLGANTTLDSIAIVIIGGTSLLGGEGAMWRTLVGILILGTIDNLFDSLGLQSDAQMLGTGAIILLAVGIDALSRRRRA